VTSDGSTLLVAGVAYGDACGLLGCDPNSEVPVGIASTDEGISWAPFNIEGRCGSNAMAFGAGRFVSVGSCADEGAIHTIE
jgi:hypothetical protein